MTFDDFCVLYVVFKQNKDDDMLQVIFQILKLSPDHFTNKSPEWQADNWPLQAQNGKPNDTNEIFFKPDLNWLARVIGLPDKAVREYY